MRFIYFPEPAAAGRLDMVGAYTAPAHSVRDSSGEVPPHEGEGDTLINPEAVRPEGRRRRLQAISVAVGGIYGDFVNRRDQLFELHRLNLREGARNRAAS